MTRAELEQKWTREHFEEIKTQGFSSPSETYENYLEMRREQEELRERQLQEILADYGTLPDEEPPDMDEEDLAALERAWQTVAQEKSREKLAA
jgi:hypothetical protein